MLPTIFNVVVDAVVQHWESLMSEGSIRDDIRGEKEAQPQRRTLRARDEGRRLTEEGLKVQEAILYAEDGMVAYTNPGWLQTAFDTLIGIFDRAGMNMNVRKTVGMVCHPCREAGVRSDEAYTQRMMGAGRRYTERHWERVSCHECRKELTRG